MVPLEIGRRGAIAAVAAAAIWPRVSQAASANGVAVGRDGWLFSAWEDIRRSDPAMIGRVTDTLNAAVALLKQAGIQVAISLTPEKSRVYREFLPEDFKWNPAAEKRYALALELLRRPGTVVPDQATLFATLRQQQPATPFFFKADTHWTAVGAAESAKLMASEIKAKIKLPPSSKPGIQLAPASDAVQERNDLVMMLPAGDQSKYPFQHFPMRKPVAAGGSGLLDDDTADVVVIGNSYMQPAYGYANDLSAELGRPTSLYWKVHQQSLYFTMLSYIRSDGFKKNRPKLIVWNLAEDDMEVSANNPGTWGQTAMQPQQFLSDMKQALGV